MEVVAVIGDASLLRSLGVLLTHFVSHPQRIVVVSVRVYKGLAYVEDMFY